MSVRWFLGFALAVSVASAAQAQATKLWITMTVSAALKEPVARLLRTERAGDSGQAIDGARMRTVASWPDGGLVVLRIEADCRRGSCMTILARLSGDTLKPELTLQAGPRLIVSDNEQPLWGADDTAAPITFEGSGGSAIVVVRRSGAWVVAAQPCEGCFPPSETEPSPPAAKPPEAPMPPETYDAFQQAITRLRKP